MLEIPFTDLLNLRQAYDAFRAFLQADYDRAPSEPVFDLLVMTYPFGRGTSDPAIWYDWLAAVSPVMLPRTPAGDAAFSPWLKPAAFSREEG